MRSENSSVTEMWHDEIAPTDYLGAPLTGFKHTIEADEVPADFFESVSGVEHNYVSSQLAPLSAREERIHERRLRTFKESRNAGEAMVGLGGLQRVRQ